MSRAERAARRSQQLPEAARESESEAPETEEEEEEEKADEEEAERADENEASRLAGEAQRAAERASVVAAAADQVVAAVAPGSVVADQFLGSVGVGALPAAPVYPLLPPSPPSQVVGPAYSARPRSRTLSREAALSREPSPSRPAAVARAASLLGAGGLGDLGVVGGAPLAGPIAAPGLLAADAAAVIRGIREEAVMAQEASAKAQDAAQAVVAAESKEERKQQLEEVQGRAEEALGAAQEAQRLGAELAQQVKVEIKGAPSLGEGPILGGSPPRARRPSRSWSRTRSLTPVQGRSGSRTRSPSPRAQPPAPPVAAFAEEKRQGGPRAESPGRASLLARSVEPEVKAAGLDLGGAAPGAVEQPVDESDAELRRLNLLQNRLQKDASGATERLIVDRLSRDSTRARPLRVLPRGEVPSYSTERIRRGRTEDKRELSRQSHRIEWANGSSYMDHAFTATRGSERRAYRAASHKRVAGSVERQLHVDPQIRPDGSLPIPEGDAAIGCYRNRPGPCTMGSSVRSEYANRAGGFGTVVRSTTGTRVTEKRRAEFAAFVRPVNIAGLRRQSEQDTLFRPLLSKYIIDGKRGQLSVTSTTFRGAAKRVVTLIRKHGTAEEQRQVRVGAPGVYVGLTRQSKGSSRGVNSRWLSHLYLVQEQKGGLRVTSLNLYPKGDSAEESLFGTHAAQMEYMLQFWASLVDRWNNGRLKDIVDERRTHMAELRDLEEQRRAAGAPTRRQRTREAVEAVLAH